MRLFVILLLLVLPLNLVAQLPGFPVLTPELSGTLQLGLVIGEKSSWLNQNTEVQINRKEEEATYIVKHPLLRKGQLSIRVKPLLDTHGFILKVEGSALPDSIKLFWAFGGCLGETIPVHNNHSMINPVYCNDNVFSIEGHAFTVYYGTSRRLRILSALTPPGSEIRLSDAHQQESPLTFFGSGKRTDAPALTALVSLNNGETVYFCFYKQNPKADYNYFMMPQLFEKGSYEVHSDSNWMKSTPD